MVYFLLDKGANPNIVADWCYYAFPLAWAAAQGDVDLVNRLLACGADPNLKGGELGSALHNCAWRGKDKDPNVKDEIGWTPLHYASQRGFVVVVKCLLEFKADPNMKNNDGQTPLHHNDGETALQVAQWRGKQDVVDMLTRRGITE
ncbi:ankyrin [Coprinellus micaceus]|uniref:Ankyrin n=1 Tax=Coprinellus micaceus TaxID=71717 RepID=A0A4Y7STY4_COPMI|nr:ankyrin [Coprinellus micaceus]